MQARANDTLRHFQALSDLQQLRAPGLPKVVFQTQYGNPRRLEANGQATRRETIASSPVHRQNEAVYLVRQL